VGWADSSGLTERTRELYRSLQPDDRVQRRLAARLSG
jgi:hypothetical protein